MVRGPGSGCDTSRGESRPDADPMRRGETEGGKVIGAWQAASEDTAAEAADRGN